MYYQGTPFIEKNKIDENSLQDYRSYFMQLETRLSFVESVFIEGKGNPDIVIYSEANPESKELQQYHKENFGDIPFHVEQTIADRVIKTTVFLGFEAKGIRIFTYDGLWRTRYEQWYDENFRLIEYRQLYYKGEDPKEIPFEERIFFATNWTTLTEKYD